MDQQQQYATMVEGIVPTHLPDGLSEFVSACYPPQDDQPVLAIRLASPGSPSKYELLTARYLTDKRSWRDLQGNWPEGNQILGWKQAIRWLHAH